MATKATSSQVYLTPSASGLTGLPGITQESAKTTSELLQDNHDKHHIFFNDMGFHNHTAHHLLAIYSLGAPSSLLRASYEAESSYQRPRPPPPSPSTVTKLPTEHLSDRSKYTVFLAYFQRRINEVGVNKTLEETFFSGTDTSEEMKIRLFAGFVHSWIHVGYGIEFHQPAIVAEGCAMAACSEGWLMDFYKAMKKHVAANEAPEKEMTIVDLLKEMRANDKLRTAARWDDGNKIKGVLERAPEELVSIVGKFRVKADEEVLERKIAESVNAAAYFTFAAQRPEKPIRIDFYLMHCVTSSLFLRAFFSLPFLTTQQKAQLLELKVWNDLAMYASRRCPDLNLSEITDYIPKSASRTNKLATYPDDAGRTEKEEEKKEKRGSTESMVKVTRTPANPWLSAIDRAMAFNEDSHVVKTVRALILGEQECMKYSDEEGSDAKGFVIKGHLWRVMAEMCVDAAEESRESGEKEVWVRSAGFDEAWKDYGERVKYRL